MAIVTIKNASRHYQDGEHLVKALRGLNMTLEQGEFTAIMGPSGSGKTTQLPQYLQSGFLVKGIRRGGQPLLVRR